MPPGTLAADLASRQLWWLMTVFATETGLALAVFSRAGILRLLAALLLVAPLLIGAPTLPAGSDAVPPELIVRFIVASLGTAALFWAGLGALGGWLYGRLERAAY